MRTVKNPAFLYIAAALSFLVPCPGRFAYGLIITVAVNFFAFAGTLSHIGISRIIRGPTLTAAMIYVLFSLVIIFKQLLTLFSPINALTIGFILNLAAVSSFISGFFFGRLHNPTMKERLSTNMKQSALFSVFILFYFLIRDLAGYGTVTLPYPHGILEYSLFKSFTPDHSFFWGSIPGALIILAVLLGIFTAVNNNLQIVGRKES